MLRYFRYAATPLLFAAVDMLRFATAGMLRVKRALRRYERASAVRRRRAR